MTIRNLSLLVAPLLLVAMSALAQLPPRIRTTTGVVYASPYGSDAASGLTTATPVRTIQRAVDIALYDMDTRGGSPAVRLADGDYTSFEVVTDGTGGNQVFVFGNTADPRAVRISRAQSGPIVYAKDKGIITLEGVHLMAQVAGVTGICAEQLAVVDFRRVIFGAMPGGNHITARGPARVNVTGDYWVDGGAVTHINAQQGGQVNPGGGRTVTIWGAPIFTWFWMTSSLGIIDTEGGPVTYVGSASASASWWAQLNGVIVSNGTQVPGGTPGVAQYGGLKF